MPKRKRDKDEDSDEEEEEDIEEVAYDDGADEEDVSKTYKKLEQLEHILLRPDTYIGSIVKEKKELWVYNDNSKMIQFKEISYVPGLYKIFDEILVNAADNKIRSSDMNRIDVTIDVANNEISVKNNGKGIPVEIHKEHDVYVPTLIFGHLLTGSHFDDNKNKVTGGRNGFGAKLCNIFSTEFVLETVDSKSKKKFRQVWKNNMSVAEEPKITSSKVKDYTMVTFKPDLAKFKMEKLEDDIVSLMMKRVHDIAGTTIGVKVYLNGTLIPVKDFQSYVKMYCLDKPLVYEKFGDRWAVGVTLSDGHFQQVSFVNSICTTQGGKHVDYITKQIVKSVREKLDKKNKGAALKPTFIKNQLFVFVCALIVNPTFSSQTKDSLTTNASSFGSKCVLTDTFLKKVSKSGIDEAVLNFADQKSSAVLKKQSGKKRVRLNGIAKLDDANDAGTKHADKCTLIITEGDSAKALAVSGLSVVGRDRYGVFPLKGKPLNVRDCATSKVTKNDEIKALTQIMGLQHGVEYTKAMLNKLRYGSIMIMADQDHDGSHIKGLIINFIHKFWPSLLQVNGFLKEFITPIVKATNKKKKKEISFFTIPEYTQWKESLSGNTSGWEIKYYKGLGTSTAKEAKEYFNNINQHEKTFKWEGDSSTTKIVSAFAKDKVDDRKKWLAAHTEGTYVDHTQRSIKYSDFFDKEFILFSLADCARSIPSLVDGLKPGQRKILFSCFKRNLKKEIKVAQLSGYVAEHSAYHHGEASLAGTIVNMAQNFVGSNNINLLVPAGQFGTRLQGGKDSASARYIFTKLAKITRYIFEKNDDEVLDYLDDDGQKIEPKWYVPVIPLVLVNGAEGIGTAWSTNIPNYNPRDIVDNVKRLIKGEETVDMTPWYKGFEGVTAMLDLNKWETRGIIEEIDDTTLKISELPVGCWTQAFKEFLQKKITSEEIVDFRENHTDITVSFTISVTEKQMQDAKEAGFYKFFKLNKKISTSNMTLFAPDGTIKTYSSTHEILKEFFNVRQEYYVKRKEHTLAKLRRELDILDNKVRFILAVVNGEIVVNKRKKTELLNELKKKKFALYPKKSKSKVKALGDISAEDGNDEDTDEENEDIAELQDGYNYLLSMALWSLTLEKVKKLEGEKAAKQGEIEVLEKTTIEEMWLRELDKFLEVLTEVENNEIKEEEEYLKKIAKKKKGKGIEIRERKFATSMYRPMPVIEMKEKKTTRAKKETTVKKETAAVTDTKKTTTTSRKKKVVKEEEPDLMDEEDDDVVKEEAEVKEKPARATRAKAASTKEVAAVVLDDSDDDLKGSLMERMKRTTSLQTKSTKPATNNQIDFSDTEDTPPAKRRRTEEKTVEEEKKEEAPNTKVISRRGRAVKRKVQTKLDAFLTPPKSQTKKNKDDDEEEDKKADNHMEDDSVALLPLSDEEDDTQKKPATTIRRRGRRTVEDKKQEEDEEKDVVETPKPSRKRGRRVVSDEEEEDLYVASSEEETPTPKPKRRGRKKKEDEDYEP